MIGYLSVDVKDGKHTGGIIVVDERGIPVEFKYTKPVQPTDLQRIIYGKALESYLHTEIIAKSLLSKLENKPQVILTDDVELLEADENVFYVSRTSESGKSEEGEYIISARGFKYRLVGNGSISQETVQMLEELAESLDIFEPFQRLHRALDYVCSGM